MCILFDDYYITSCMNASTIWLEGLLECFDMYLLCTFYLLLQFYGAEHGVPILVSNFQSGKPAHSCGLLRIMISDTILSVNGHNLRNSHHRDAVTVLQSVGEEVVSDNSDDKGERNHQQQQQQPLLTRDSSVPPQNEVDSVNSKNFIWP